ncbi:MAG: hypothetical protein AVDCRST_MAG29-1438, partial [uncultured Nocardioidaceae bacterium]
ASTPVRRHPDRPHHGAVRRPAHHLRDTRAHRQDDARGCEHHDRVDRDPRRHDHAPHRCRPPLRRPGRTRSHDHRTGVLADHRGLAHLRPLELESHDIHLGGLHRGHRAQPPLHRVRERALRKPV